MSGIQCGCPLQSDHPKIIIHSNCVVVWMHRRLGDRDVLNIVKLDPRILCNFMHPKRDVSRIEGCAVGCAEHHIGCHEGGSTSV